MYLKRMAHSFLKSFVATVVKLTEVREKFWKKKKEEKSNMWKGGMLKYVGGKPIEHFFKAY